MTLPDWLMRHRDRRAYMQDSPVFFQDHRTEPAPAFMKDVEFNRHEFNDGTHVSPFDEGTVHVGVSGLKVRLRQGIDEESFRRVLSRTLRATTGIHPDEPDDGGDWEEMMKGGLQSALETQTIVFEVYGASRALTHQLVRTRKAGFHQQSQRATWYGDRPNVRWPQSVTDAPKEDYEEKPYVQMLWEQAQLAAWAAYQAACEAGISYQDARYILPEGTANYIVCEYTVREFINVFAYRGCSMFLWEMVGCMREMRRVLLEAHPFLEPYVKISCEKGTECKTCGGRGSYTCEWSDSAEKNPKLKAKVLYYPDPPDGTVEFACHDCNGIGSNRKCTFQGWENVEQQCDFPWAKQTNRVFLPAPKYRIGK